MSEAVHLSALLPLALLVVFGKGLGGAWWLVGLAFAVSWAGDSFAYLLGGSWVASYFWLPVQVALVLVAFQDDPLYKPMIVMGVALLAVSSAQISAPGPEWLMTLVGSIAVMAVAKGVLAWPMMVYFGIGSIAYLVMIARIGTEGFHASWLWYQGSREMAFALFIVLMFHVRKRVTT